MISPATGSPIGIAAWGMLASHWCLKACDYILARPTGIDARGMLVNLGCLTACVDSPKHLRPGGDKCAWYVSLSLVV